MVTERQLERVLRGLEPELQKALVDAFDGMRKGVDMAALERAVMNYDIDGVIDALNVDEGYFSIYALVAMSIFVRYTRLYSQTINGVGLVVFNAPLALPAVQAVIQQNSAQMTADTIAGIRAVVAEGLGKRETAKRIRDMIGLSTPQMEYAQNMRRRLESGNPADLRAILAGMTLRDKRFDKTIRKAIEAGKPIAASKIDAMVNAYTRKLRSKRAKDIASVEVQQYAETGKFEAVKQAALAVGGVVEKEWQHSSIWKNARPDHVSMNRVKVLGVQTPFVMADGVEMQYAHDPAGGAKHNANCRCVTKYSVRGG